MNAVVTAGGRIDGGYARCAGTTHKALAPIRGATMLARTIRALRDANVGQIAVVGDDEVRAAVGGSVERIVPDGGSGVKNVLAALRAWPEDEPLLLLTCDMPYVDGISVERFIGAVMPDVLAMPLAEYDAFAARFPQSPPFGITLGGERVVNGGIFHIPSGSRARLASFAAALFDARKAPWRMAAIAGPSLLASFLFKRLTIAALESRARELLGINVAAIRQAPPELAYDADTLDDYRYACEHA